MIPGLYFPVASSKAVNAKLLRVDHELQLRVDGSTEIIKPDLLDITDKLGNVPRKFNFADGSIFEASNDADVDDFMNIRRSFFSRLSRLEGNLGFVAIAAVITIALLMGIYRYGMPMAAAAAASVTPATVTSAIDSGTFQSLDRAFFDDSKLDESRQVEIRNIFEQLALLVDGDEPNHTLHFRDGGSLGANAFALPGGSIIVTDQLVELAENDDEIAGVLAHEIGHVESRHSLKQLYRVLGITFMLGVIAGDSSQIVGDVISQGVVLQSLSYSRQFEMEADQYSVELMAKVNRDAVAFLNLLDRVVDDKSVSNDGSGWLSTHPSNAERRDAVINTINRLRN
ncbi:MAG: M48 family metallopeptidase [Rhizobiaceae bacterium]